MTIERLQDDSPTDLLSPLVDLRQLEALAGNHPLGLSFGRTERWVYHEDGTPVAVLLISIIPSQHTGSLEWLFVAPAHRKKGIAGKLLQQALADLKLWDIQAVSVYFAENEINKSLLKHFHHTEPTPFVEKFRFDIQSFAPSWLKKTLPLPQGFKVIPWSELTAKEVADLEHRFDQFQIPASLSPFRLPKLLYRSCSVAIRGNGKIVSWCVCHSFDEDNMEFSSLYADPQLGMPVLGFVSLVESIKRLKADPTVNAWMLIRLKDDPIFGWKNFIRKRLAGEAKEIQLILGSAILIENRS